MNAYKIVYQTVFFVIILPLFWLVRLAEYMTKETVWLAKAIYKINKEIEEEEEEEDFGLRLAI